TRALELPVGVQLAKFPVSKPQFATRFPETAAQFSACTGAGLSVRVELARLFQSMFLFISTCSKGLSGAPELPADGTSCTTTGDAAAPTVVQEVPSAGNSGAPLNPLLQVLMNKNIDWNSLASSTLTLSPAPVQALNCAAVSGNLVANCGFETGNLANWTPTGNSSARVATNQPHSGSYIFCFCNDSPAGTISQTITDAPNTTYTLTFYLSDQGTGSPVLFQALWNGTPVVAIGPSIAT